MEIVQGNALTYLERAQLPPRYKVVANIPYQITGALIRILLERVPQPEKIVLMVQKEVADRLVAEPKSRGGTGEMSMLTIMAQYYANVKKIGNVSAGAFYPAPKVDSAIIALTPFGGRAQEYLGLATVSSEVAGRDTPSPLGHVVDDKQFFAIVKKAFGGRRKKLSTTLRGITSPTELQKAFQASSINAESRPQDLTIHDWRQLCYNLAKRRK